MDKSSTPIVVVAFNRPRSLMRLLDSMKKASYPNKDIDLIISIDKGNGNEDVWEIAKEFEWEFGNKKVLYQPENLGLRKHILQCGGMSMSYGSVIVLEDDLYVSPNFYFFAQEALSFSKDKPYIGGISLYNHQLNVHTRDNFNALDDGYDNWYFQFASSWGQAWTKDQWSGFMQWYDQSPEIADNNDIPFYVRSWSEKSWLKYNISYLVVNNMYFLYPKTSLSTNFSDAGTHVGQDSTVYQVPLDFSKRRTYTFADLEGSDAVYDAFYENRLLHMSLGLDAKDLCVDLFGYKQHSGQKYLLTSRIMDFKICKSFGKSLKPLDANIVESIAGNEFFLYDTEVIEKNSTVKDFGRTLSYNVKHLSYNDAAKYTMKEIRGKVRRGLRKIFGR